MTWGTEQNVKYDGKGRFEKTQVDWPFSAAHEATPEPSFIKNLIDSEIVEVLNQEFVWASARTISN